MLWNKKKVKVPNWPGFGNNASKAKKGDNDPEEKALGMLKIKTVEDAIPASSW